MPAYASFALFSYVSGAVLYLGLNVWLLTSWRGRPEGGLLLACVFGTFLWSAAMAAGLAGIPIGNAAIGALEAVRNGLWLLFLARLQGVKDARREASRDGAWWLTCIAMAACLLALGVAATSPVVCCSLQSDPVVWYQVVAPLLTVLVGLIGIEQLLRNTAKEYLWALKFLYLGVGGLFLFDFVMYSKMMLMGHSDPDFVLVRGLAWGASAPLIAVAAARNPQWSINVFVSRDVVFHGATVMISGIYLLAMAAMGYYLRSFGGTLGGAAQLLFLTAVVGTLLIVLLSGRAQARLRKFLNENFYEYKYDYREEWLRFTQRLSGETTEAVNENAVRAIAEIVESPRGQLWLMDDDGCYVVAGLWQMPEAARTESIGDAEFTSWLAARRTVVDVTALRDGPAAGDVPELPEPLLRIERLWLLIPLLLRDQLYGWVALTRSRAAMTLGWEEEDLLLTAGRQAASFLALARVSDALSRARQFDTFNRLSAFAVHDLKNTVAQLGLVVSNSRRYRDNPEFIADALETIDNATQRMNRLLAQLRKRQHDNHGPIDLEAMLRQAVGSQSGAKPVPILNVEDSGLHVLGDRDRFRASMQNLIQNAQEACSENDVIIVSLKQIGDIARVSVSDSGSGMSPEFVRERLFKPFDTTKGNAGMGIGAYDARETIRALHGSIDVQSELGTGTKFVIEIPLRASADVTPLAAAGALGSR